MSFSIEVTPQRNATGAMVHTVVVTIDDHETVLNFGSPELAEAFAQTERARLTEEEKNAQRHCEQLAVGRAVSDGRSG
jgi:transposase